MVSLTSIKSSNARLLTTVSKYTAVFVGGTSGIGKATVQALVASGTKCTIYIVGRPSSRSATQQFIDQLRPINTKAEIIWTEAEVSLLQDVKRACDHIRSQETTLDLLFMTCGYAPFGSRIETAEGLEVTQSLEYYCRILFTQHLLPLLSKSKAPRVVSVLAGGKEPASVPLDDLDLKQLANFGGFKSQLHYTAMNTMTLERLAEMWPDVSFVHSFPGWVITGNHRRGADKASLLSRAIWPLVDPLIGLMSMSLEESGQRYLFVSTSAAFGGKGVPWDDAACNSRKGIGPGLFLVGYKCDEVDNDKAVSALRESAQETIWEHTQGKLQPYL